MALDTETPETAPKATRKKAAEDARVVLTLDPGVRKYLASQARGAKMDVNQFVLKLVEDFVCDTAPEDMPMAQRIRARRGVIEHVIEQAKRIDAEGGFNEHFVLNVMKAAGANEDFRSLYDLAIANGMQRAAKVERNRAALNQHLGRLIKGTVRARSLRNEAGRIQRAQVEDEMISSYTLLEKPAPKAE